jgi:hypothetical protein
MMQLLLLSIHLKGNSVNFAIKESVEIQVIRG